MATADKKSVTSKSPVDLWHRYDRILTIMLFVGCDDKATALPLISTSFGCSFKEGDAKARLGCRTGAH